MGKAISVLMLTVIIQLSLWVFFTRCSDFTDACATIPNLLKFVLTMNEGTTTTLLSFILPELFAVAVVSAILVGSFWTNKTEFPVFSYIAYGLILSVLLTGIDLWRFIYSSIPVDAVSIKMIFAAIISGLYTLWAIFTLLDWSRSPI